MSSYTVNDTAGATAVRATVASLPLSFRAADPGETAHVHAVAGTPGWTAAALRAVDDGARGIVVVAPCVEDTSALAEAAEAAGTAVVLDLRWESNPGLAGAEEAVRSTAGRAVMLDSLAVSAAGSDPGTVLTEHLAAVVRVTGSLDALRILHLGPHGYTAAARLANAAPATLQGVLSNAVPAGVELHLHSDDGGVSVTVPEPSAAWPAEVRATASQGELLLPTLYETAHRNSWRRLKDHLDAGTLPADLAGFARLTEQLTGPS
ncbi:hypothetical protein BIU82_04215 [Arthrobacter sp. SW1]|uniref:hypothetical protein n=1 Tax=Arthrobacter sp. SW1 TaxID=1920889 RepID=UPI000877B1FF|nr:hypothetical protein [Arthrobacter sp. SW1]OFI38530.1 hypothetical protein BIU82_04215 [Arthrobacter sp. SW1]